MHRVTRINCSCLYVVRKVKYFKSNNYKIDIYFSLQQQQQKKQAEFIFINCATSF